MPPRKKNGCMDWEGMIGPSENSNGMVNVNPTGNQIGTSPSDFVGRQQHNWDGGIHGDRFDAIGPDGLMSEAEKRELYGPMPVGIPAAPSFRRRR